MSQAVRTNTTESLIKLIEEELIEVFGSKEAAIENVKLITIPECVSKDLGQYPVWEQLGFSLDHEADNIRVKTKSGAIFPLVKKKWFSKN